MVGVVGIEYSSTAAAQAHGFLKYTQIELEPGAGKKNKKATHLNKRSATPSHDCGMGFGLSGHSVHAPYRHIINNKTQIKQQTQTKCTHFLISSFPHSHKNTRGKCDVLLYPCGFLLQDGDRRAPGRDGGGWRQEAIATTLNDGSSCRAAESFGRRPPHRWCQRSYPTRNCWEYRPRCRADPCRREPPAVPR